MVMFFQGRRVETSRKQSPPAPGGPRPALIGQATEDWACDRLDKLTFSQDNMLLWQQAETSQLFDVLM